MEIQYKNKSLGSFKIRISASSYIDKGLACKSATSSLQNYCWRMLLSKISQAQIK